MNIWPQNYRAIVGAFVVASFAASPSAKSCGDFRKPETHFDGVNEYGFVSYWDQLGEIKLANGSVLPLIIGFRSDWETLSPSPHLGSGWLLGLLDAHFVQRSENAFDMISIDGYTVPFGRDPKIPSILNGAQGWKAEIKGDVVTVWAECGWKLQFTKGKISGITTPQNSVVQIRRDPTGLVRDVVEGTNVLLKVTTDSKGNVDGLVLASDQKIEISLVEKPSIQNLNGINVVGSKSLAIGEIVMPSGTKKNFDYTPAAELQPSMSISEAGAAPRILTWNSVTRHISSDGLWRYEIKPSEILGHNAAISRTNEKNQNESWHFDRVKGTETLVFDGVTTIRSWFISGLLNGKPRSERTISKAGEHTKKFIYNENAVLIREDDGRSAKVYDEHGRLIKEYVNNIEVFSEEFSEKGFSLRRRNGDYEKVAVSISSSLVEEEVRRNGQLLYRRLFDASGKLVSIQPAK